MTHTANVLAAAVSAADASASLCDDYFAACDEYNRATKTADKLAEIARRNADTNRAEVTMKAWKKADIARIHAYEKKTALANLATSATRRSASLAISAAKAFTN